MQVGPPFLPSTFSMHVHRPTHMPGYPWMPVMRSAEVCERNKVEGKAGWSADPYTCRRRMGS